MTETVIADLHPILARLVAGHHLSHDEAFAAFEAVMAGRATPAQIGALLTALALRTNPDGSTGPTVEEISGAARAMRNHALMIDTPAGLDPVDTCGTGGDRASTFNISTAAALIAAGAGVPVAKHGNRSVTSSSGSSQVLDALGVNLAAPPPLLTRALAEANICFCFAPAHHPAMKHAAPVRRQLGFRTIFNMLGPLTNPAGARRQVMGVYDPALTEPIARVLIDLGSSHVMVVHGLLPGGGLDELSTFGPTRITEATLDSVKTTQFEPHDLGILATNPNALRVSTVDESAQVIRDVLDGKPGPARDIAALNAAAAIVVADNAPDLAAALPVAYESIDSGNAAEALKKLAEITNSE